MQNNCSEIVEIVLSQKIHVPVKSAYSKSAMVPFWKRALDVSVILLAAPIALLVGGAVALIIKLGSRGPVIFKQERVGYKGQRFVCFKFRTMQVGAETGAHHPVRFNFTGHRFG